MPASHGLHRGGQLSRWFPVHSRLNIANKVLAPLKGGGAACVGFSNSLAREARKPCLHSKETRLDLRVEHLDFPSGLSVKVSDEISEAGITNPKPQTPTP